MLRLQAFETEEIEAMLRDVRAGTYRTFEELQAAHRLESEERMKRLDASTRAREK